METNTEADIPSGQWKNTEFRQAVQRSVKFLRWLRAAIRDRLAEAPAVLRLKAL